MDTPSRILIVEDEPLIAMMLEDFIDMLGYQVAGTADSVDGALTALGGGDVDAAILDVHLRGGEKSWPIADALAAQDIPFVVSTGGGNDILPDSYRDRPTLAKPFTMDGVKQVLAELA